MSDVRSFKLDGAGAVSLRHDAPSLNALSLSLPDGVYTSLRTYSHRRVLRLDEHFDRLEESAALEGHPLQLDRRVLRSTLDALVTATGFPLARVRITIGLPERQIYLGLEQLTEPPAAAYTNGVACTIADRSLHRANPRSKRSAFIKQAVAARGAASGMDEVLLVAADGSILEGSASNFFAVLDGRLRTAEDDVLAGITRHIVLSLAEAIVPLDPRPVNVTDLPALREAFITSVSRAVMPVVSMAGRPVGAGRPGPITLALIDAFARMLERELEPIAPGGETSAP